LQERLAKAVESRSSTPSLRQGSPSLTSSSPRASLDVEPIEDKLAGQGNNNTLPIYENTISTESNVEPIPSHSILQEKDIVKTTASAEEITKDQASGRQSLESQDRNHEFTKELRLGAEDDTTDERQEEITQYLEQIDSLRAKLQYLTKEAANDAREVANTAERGSVKQQLAEKDEKIALLLEEGSKLSQNEMKLMTTIKKLRAKSIDDEKNFSQAKRSQAEAERSVKTLQEKLKALEINDKEDSKLKSVVQSLEKEISQLQEESGAKDLRISQLQEEVAKGNSASTTELDIWRQRAEAAQKVISALQDEISDTKIEKGLLEDRYKAQLRELESKLDRGIQDAKSTELDLRREIQVQLNLFVTFCVLIWLIDIRESIRNI
jgi:TATA element modulatory factor